MVEVILAVAIFALISTGVIGAIIYGQESTAVAGARERASKIAEEGIEAVRNIRDSGYSNLPVDGTYGLVLSGGVWTLSGFSDITDIFTRTVTLSTVNSRERNVVVNVTWNQTVQRTGSVSLNTYLADWVTPNITKRGGMLVYGDGGTTTDAIKYRTIDSSGNWGTAASTADIDGATTNKALRASQLYVKPASTEKILVSRHYDGTRQYIYAQIWNGTGWGNVVHLTSATNGWAASTFLDVQNFSGTYLSNGNFTVLYSDGTNTVKNQTWNGTTWSAGTNLPAVTTGPVYIVAKTQPGTNNVMAVITDQGNRSLSTYWNGTTWGGLVVHSSATPSNTKQLIDFDWSPNTPTKGAITYADSATSRRIATKIYDQPSNTWSAAASGANQGGAANRLNSVSIIGRPGAGINTFTACNKDTSYAITCSLVTPNANVATAPALTIYGSYPSVTAATDTGIQRSFGFGFENSGTSGLIAFSDNTATAKFEILTPGSPGSFGAAQTLGLASGNPIRTARVEANNYDDDLMMLVADNNRTLYSVVWDGTGNALYSSGGRAFTAQGTNGSATTDYWYDFVWDAM